MKINNHKKNSKRTLILAAALTAVVIVGVGGYLLFKVPDNQQQESPPPADTSVEDSVDSGSTSELPPKSTEPIDNTADDQFLNGLTSDPSIEQPNILRFSQASDGNSIRIVATLEHPTDGKCVAVLSNQSLADDITRESEIVVSPSNYSCSFTVARQDMSASGDWDLVVYHIVGSSYNVSQKSTLEVK